MLKSAPKSSGASAAAIFTPAGIGFWAAEVDLLRLTCWAVVEAHEVAACDAIVAEIARVNSESFDRELVDVRKSGQV